MNYKIICGSLLYNDSITEEIFKDLTACARAHGLKFQRLLLIVIQFTNLN